MFGSTVGFSGLVIRAGFKGGPGGPGPRPPTNRGPHQTLHILFLVQLTLIQLHIIYDTLLTSRIIFSDFNTGCTTTVEYFTLFLVLTAEYFNINFNPEI